MLAINHSKTDRDAYDEKYRGKISPLSTLKSRDEYIAVYERCSLSPFYVGGGTKGYVRGEATRRLIRRAGLAGIYPGHITILDAGSGLGELSVYLACKGYKVVGVDISSEGCRSAAELAARIGVSDKCTFIPVSLESVPIGDRSVDFVIGHASLHHFIKYDGVPRELMRVMKDGAECHFADGFGENKAYHLFHDKKKMRRLGDVPLTKRLIMDFFVGFDVELVPTDWFVMLDKLYLRVLPENLEWLVRKLSRIHFHLDRKIPSSSRLSLLLSGSVMTIVRKRAYARATMYPDRSDL